MGRVRSENENPPLEPGQLRYVPQFGLLMRVREPVTDGWRVQRVPDGHPHIVRAIEELRKAPIVAEDGFRSHVAHAHGAAPGEVHELLRMMLADEMARGHDRLRLRVLDEYVGGLDDSAKWRERLVEALTASDRWTRVGSKADAGYVLSDGGHDWRRRWRDAELPGDRLADEAAALTNLEHRLSTLPPPTVGRVVVTRWLPRALRDAALSDLRHRLTDPQRIKGCAGVRDDALLRVIEAEELDATAPEGPSEGDAPRPDHRATIALTTLNGASAAVRAAAVTHLARSPEWTHRLPELLGRAEREGDPRTLAQLMATPELVPSRTRLLTALFRRPPSGIEESVLHEVRALLRAWGLESFALLEIALEVTHERSRAEAWLATLAAGLPVDLRGLIVGLATARFVEVGHGRLSHLAYQPPALRAAVERSFGADDDAEVMPLPEDEPTESWVLKYTASAERQEQRFATGALRDLVVRLLAICSRWHQEAEVWRKRAQDPLHAQGVLGKAEARDVRQERADLLASVEREFAGIRATERAALARLFSEVFTAVGRTREAGRLEMLADLERRLAELASEFQLAPLGVLGEEVEVDPDAHEIRAGGGSRGIIRRIGIRTQDGQILVRAGVYPHRS